MIKFLATENGHTTFLSALRPMTFPAGEAHVTREDRRELSNTEIAVLYGSTDLNADLFTLKMWVDYLDHYPHVKKALILPYFPAARMDRGAPFGLKVYVDFIHSLNLDVVSVFDPHSQTTAELLNAKKGLDTRYTYPEELFLPRTAYNDKAGYTGVIAPDEGARLRAEGVAKAFGVPVYQAVKKREFATGKLSGFECEPLPQEGKFLLVDDICDGGGTFLGLAKHLGLPPEQLDLYVSHGVFSGLSEDNLPLSFGNILTTDSYDPARALPGEFFRMNIIGKLIEKALTK
jgi:ribose-phosphate pyrophosphokinase